MQYFKRPALNWNRFLADLTRSSNSLNSDRVYVNESGIIFTIYIMETEIFTFYIMETVIFTIYIMETEIFTV